MTIEEAQKKLTLELQKKKIFTAILDVEVLLAHVLKKSHEFVLAHPERKLTARQASKLADLVKRRSKHCPIAYLTGEKEFFGYPFSVNKNVLIPRPETELLVEEALGVIAANPAAEWRVVDVGTGSGAIIVALAKKLADLGLPISRYELMATEISAAALGVAKKNARKNGIEKHITFLRGNILKPIRQRANIIIANLPYLSFEEYYNSDFYDVIKWEPKHALTDEKDGLQNFRKFFQQAPSVLAAEGRIIMEIGYEQGRYLKEMALRAFPKAKVEIKKDYCDFDRVVVVNL